MVVVSILLPLANDHLAATKQIGGKTTRLEAKSWRHFIYAGDFQIKIGIRGVLLQLLEYEAVTQRQI